MTALPLGLVPNQHPSPQTNDDGFLDDETFSRKTDGVPTIFGERDLVRDKPDLALSAF